MELEKTKNTINGFFVGTVAQIINLLLPFLLRTVMIYSIGIEYAGVNSLFTSIINVLSLANLGFSSAVIFSMYKPIKENDYDQLGKLLGYYRYLYYIVGTVILVCGLAVMPFLRQIVTSEIPGNMNLYFLYFCFVFNASVTYLFGGYRSSVLFAYQRNDIYSIVSTVVIIIGYTLQIFALLLFKNYYAYLFLMIAINLATNVAAAYAAKRMFPKVNPRSGLDAESKKMIFSKVKDLLYQRIGNTFSTSLDSMVISRYIGLAAVAIYGNYFYIFSAANSFMSSFFSSLTAGVGNKILNSSREENIVVYHRLTTISGLLVAFCCACLACLYQPFMKLWMGESLMYPMDVVICLVLYFFVAGARRIVGTYKDALGLWHPDRWKSIVGAGVNLVLNVALVKTIGVSGVVISTIVSYLFVEMPWETHVLYKQYFEIPEIDFYQRLLKQFLTTVIVCAGSYGLTMLVQVENTFLNFLIAFVITVPSALAILWLLYRKNDDFRFMMERITQFAKQKLHRA